MMKKLLSKLALMLVVALIMGLGVAVTAVAALPDPVVTKNLNMPQHVSVPAGGLEFQFSFERISTTPPIAPGVLEIPNQTISFAAGTPSPAAGFLTGTADFESIINANAFRNTPGLNAGTQDWRVREVIPLPAAQVPGMTYDQSEFILRIHFSNNLDPITQQPLNPRLNIFAVEVFRTHDRNGAPVTPVPGQPGIKYNDGLAFVNTFAPTIGSATEPALTISKTIGGDDRPYANLSQLFRFTLALTAPQYPLPLPPGVTAQPTLPTPIPALIVSGPGAGTQVPTTVERPTSISIVNGAATFYLRDGERLRIDTLPAGTTYTVTETGVPNFTPNAIVTVGGAPAPNVTAPTGQDLAASGAVSNLTPPPNNTLDNRADFTNIYHRTIVAGLVLTSSPFFAVGIAVLGLTLMMASRSRKRIEEMPIAY